MESTGEILPHHQYLPTPGPWHKFNTTGNDEEAILVAYFPEKREAIYTIGEALREDEFVELDVSAYMGQTLHTWIIFRSGNCKYISNSEYTGAFVVE